ncbi:methyltransferase domain-containing protein [Spirillospora sp. CA-294931]|uniref:class I SAM-dependent methyltransferase n=1 Tax=Spirillospora sp. CA-294931 TaxID=3240042 RepID=UPI003D9476DF
MIEFPLLVGACLVADAVRLRLRLGGLGRVEVGERTGEPLRWDADPGDGTPYGLVTAEGAVLSTQIRRAAVAHARDRGLQVLDLVPMDLPVERALDLARGFDPKKYRDDPVALGRGAGFATFADHELLERAGVPSGAMDLGEFAAVTVRLRQYAGARRRVPALQGAPGAVPLAEPEGYAADLAIVPCHTTPSASAFRGRRAWLRGLGIPLLPTLAVSMLVYALVLLTLATNLGWGLVTVAAYCAVPYVVFAGTPLSPRDLHRASLLRLVHVPWSWWRALADPPSAWERRWARREDEARAHYEAELAKGTKRFQGIRREDCPWCGSPGISRHVRSRDMIQAKPGRFVLERCGDCGHVFQNPRLTDEGLAFYYRDVYDGLGAEASERGFSMQDGFYRARVNMVASRLSPRTWLDVGTGHGHFCRTAQAVLPDTAFDGLDMGAGVQEGERRGWLRHAYQGVFIEKAAELAGKYDVVSMHHYLEHTVDPRAELDAAARVLGPGGHLLIEVPDPESRLGRFFGRLWVPWLQPEHLNLIPIGNLERDLASRGLRVVARERREAHQRYDTVFAVLIATQVFGPSPKRPWAERPPGPGAWLRRAAVLTLAAPALVVAALADKLLVPLIPGTSNAYRILARKDEP